MNIQSISIVVPTKRCVNNCPFCISKMHDNDYDNSWSHRKIRKRLKYAMNNGVNTCIITGTGEALQNKKYLSNLIQVFEDLGHPFPNVELQTTGVFLNKENFGFLKYLGVNTISLSVSDIKDDANNMKMIEVPEHLQFKLKDLIKEIKDEGFNIRLSINMTNIYDSYTPWGMMEELKLISPDHVTFRELYYSADNFTDENEWVKLNSCKKELFSDLSNYIRQNGTKLYKLPYGPIAYSIEGMSVVIDDDCMSKENVDTLKYVILREDGRLYCQWDDPGSLIF